jgi:hypothetical protein
MYVRMYVCMYVCLSASTYVYIYIYIYIYIYGPYQIRIHVYRIGCMYSHTCVPLENSANLACAQLADDLVLRLGLVLAVRVSIGDRVTATVRDKAWVSVRVRVSVDHTPIAAVVRPESSCITFGADGR